MDNKKADHQIGFRRCTLRLRSLHGKRPSRKVRLDYPGQEKQDKRTSLPLGICGSSATAWATLTVTEILLANA
jgi:hypothetical protein